MTVLCLEQIPMDPQSNDPSQSDKQDVLCLCFSPSEETLIASTSKNQLYTITMSLTEISKVSFFQGHQSPSSPHWDAQQGMLTMWIGFHAKLCGLCALFIQASRKAECAEALWCRGMGVQP